MNFKILGRIFISVENSLRSLKRVLNINNNRRMSDVSSSKGYESTGIHLSIPGKPKLCSTSDGVVYVRYDDLSHTLWRAQEFTLFNRYRNLLKEPILDLGCGDGSFASALFENIQIGLDPDSDALKIASQTKIYGNHVNRFAENTNLESGSVNTIISNSVLEHTHNLGEIIKEASRLLSSDGILMLTVPNNDFTNIMSDLFGNSEADRLNREVFFHRNLLSNQSWRELLELNGFRIQELRNYQDENINFVFRLLRSPILKRLGRQFDFLSEQKLHRLVTQSLDGGEGAGTFIVAQKNKKALKFKK